MSENDNDDDSAGCCGCLLFIGLLMFLALTAKFVLWIFLLLWNALG